MNTAPQDAWFYSQGSERLGPLTLTELRVKAQEGSLNPRMDLVWTQGMAEWKPAGEIDGLFEKRSAPEPVEPLAAAADPYQTPNSGDGAEMLSQEGGWPGARRRSFYLMTILFPFAWNLGFAFGAAFLAQQFGPEIMGVATIGAAFVPVVLAIYFGLQRLVNVGMSRWWYLGNLVPILNFWVGYRMYVCPAGYAYHKKLDGVGVLLAILYWLMIGLMLLSIIAVIAVLFGMIDNPEIKQQFEEVLRSLPKGAATP